MEGISIQSIYPMFLITVRTDESILMFFHKNLELVS